MLLLYSKVHKLQVFYASKVAMIGIKPCSFSSPHISMILTKPATIPSFTQPFKSQQPESLSFRYITRRSKVKLNSSSFSRVSIEPEDAIIPNVKNEGETEKFDWYSHWYPVMPLCDLDKSVPHAKRILGIDVVVWWDRNEKKWQVFEDKCPHRLTPLSEGRIDEWGRLQCVYHGWCFNGSGNYKFIPQAPPDGPKVNTSKKARVAVYPTIEQNEILWFWPNSTSQYKDIAMKEKPPYFPELDDPSYYKQTLSTRDFPYGYEVMIENFMDPSHVPYAHYDIMPWQSDKSRPKADREGGIPMEITVQTSDINGFFAKEEIGYSKFLPPCLFYAVREFGPRKGSAPLGSIKEEQSKNQKQQRMLLIFLCIPVSPGNSRMITVTPTNYGTIVPRWMCHLGQNLVIDSDLNLLHMQERKINDAGPSNWHKVCFVPTKADAMVIAFRMWLRKYSGGQVDWGAKFSGYLPPTPPREQLLDRYRSHVLNCRSCQKALKCLKALEVTLQVISASIGIAAALKQDVMSMGTKVVMVSMAVLFFAASKWLSHFSYKNFYFHDYNHALRKKNWISAFAFDLSPPCPSK